MPMQPCISQLIPMVFWFLHFEAQALTTAMDTVCQARFRTFANGEISVKLEQSVSNYDVFGARRPGKIWPQLAMVKVWFQNWGPGNCVLVSRL